MDHETLGAALALAKKTLADPELIEEKVEGWLDDHPEATTTVQDGAISYSKLDASLKGKADEVSQLSNALQDSERNLHLVYEILDRQEIIPEFLSGYWAISDGYWRNTATAYNGTEQVPVIAGSIISTDIIGEKYWIFWQEDGTFLSTITGTNIVNVIVPDNAAYFALDALVENISENAKITFYSEMANNASNANTCKFRTIGTSIPKLAVRPFRFDRYAYSGGNGTASQG